MRQNKTSMGKSLAEYILSLILIKQSRQTVAHCLCAVMSGLGFWIRIRVLFNVFFYLHFLRTLWEVEFVRIVKEKNRIVWRYLHFEHSMWMVNVYSLVYKLFNYYHFLQLLVLWFLYRIDRKLFVTIDVSFFNP